MNNYKGWEIKKNERAGDMNIWWAKKDGTQLTIQIYGKQGFELRYVELDGVLHGHDRYKRKQMGIAASIAKYIVDLPKEEI